MADRPRLRLLLGAGLNRETGAAQREPGTWRELQNVRIKKARALARAVHVEASEIAAMDGGGAPTAIAFIGVFLAAPKGILVAWKVDGVADNVQVWSTATTGLNPIFVDDWGTLDPSVAPPQFFGAEINVRYLLAHDEADIDDRLQTAVLTDALVLSLLTADLDGLGAQPVYFRGVATYLDYSWGWGFGSNSEPDIAHVVRFSMPGDPLTWRAEFYFFCGAKGDPVLAVVGVPGRLLVFKGQSIYQILGSKPSNFTVGLADGIFGLVASHLWVLRGGTVFFWSRMGPRVISGGGDSIDLSELLELDEGFPEDVPMPTDFSTAFAIDNPQDRCIEFCFPNRDTNQTVKFILALENDQPKGWSYDVVPWVLHSAGLLFASAAGRPAGAPINLALSAGTGSNVLANWDNSNYDGDETIEVWYNVNGGTYLSFTELSVTGPTQSFELENPGGTLWSAGDTIGVAVRYRRGAVYTAGYDNPVISGWGAPEQATSADTFVVSSSAAAPTAAVGVCETVEFGPKDYLRWHLSWTQTEFAVGAQVEISEGQNPDPDLNPILVTQDATDTTADLGDYLISPGGSSTPRYMYVRQTFAGGSLPSPWVAFDVSPFVPNAGCVA